MNLAPDPATERLTFHRPALGDYNDTFALWSDTATTDQVGAPPSGAEECWMRLLRNVGHWAVLGYGGWSIRDRATGRFMGEVGLKQFRRAMEAELETLPEIGWVLAPWARGLGLATEAARAVLAWADANLDENRVVCMIGVDNDASIGVARKCGFAERGVTTYKDHEVLVFTRARQVTRLA